MRTNQLLHNAQNHKLKEVFSNCKIISSQRQPKNLLKHLSSAKFTNKSNETTQDTTKTKKCTDPRCKICKLYLQTCEEFKLSNGKQWKIKCKSTIDNSNDSFFTSIPRLSVKVVFFICSIKVW